MNLVTVSGMGSPKAIEVNVDCDFECAIQQAYPEGSLGNSQVFLSRGGNRSRVEDLSDLTQNGDFVSIAKVASGA